jgi:hypothetical protein
VGFAYNTWGTSWGTSWGVSWGGGTAPAPSGGGTSRKRGDGWGREREILEQSLRRIEQEDVRRIATQMAESDRPQARRIARKLVDYTGELRELQSLQREIAKLQAAQREQIADQQLRQQQESELAAAAVELRQLLRDEEEVLAAVQLVIDLEARTVLNALGVTVH